MEKRIENEIGNIGSSSAEKRWAERKKYLEADYKM
jgi:hypothetical protein